MKRFTVILNKTRETKGTIVFEAPGEGPDRAAITTVYVRRNALDGNETILRLEVTAEE